MSERPKFLIDHPPLGHPGPLEIRQRRASRPPRCYVRWSRRPAREAGPLALKDLAMPELRKDPIVGRWVIIAIERAKRPHDFKHQEQSVVETGACPFCEGNEGQTPPEILAYRDRGARPNGQGWRVRVVPNKFPALKIEGSLEKRGEGIYDKMAGIGAHEVIIESPKHHVSMATLAEENIREILWVYRDRLVDLKKDNRLAHGMFFKNVGAAAGASLEHTHSQLIVTPTVPISVWEEMTGGLEFYNYRGRCIYCDIIQQELATESRIVLDTPYFTAFCPYASRFPFETWILPKAHSSHYEKHPQARRRRPRRHAPHGPPEAGAGARQPSL